MLPSSEEVKAVSAILPSQGLVKFFYTKGGPCAAPPLSTILTLLFSVITKLIKFSFQVEKDKGSKNDS